MSLSFIQLSKYDIPEAVVDRTNEWVGYGKDNDFFQRLIDAKQSPTNSALINSITDLIYGRGLYAKDAARNVEGYAAMVGLFSEECIRRLSEDYYSFGWGMLQLVYNKQHTQIVEVYHTPSNNWRSGKVNKDGDIDTYFYSDDWKEVSKRNPPKAVPAFGTSKEGLEVICIKPYRSGHIYYSPVEYFSGLPYCDLEIALAKYHINNVKNKFSANAIINFNNGTPTEEQAREIEMKIKRKFEGEEGEGILVAFNDNREAAATIEGVDLPDAHSQYAFISEEASRKIMASHRVTSPILVGLGGGGGLGNNADELRIAATLFDNQVIKPIQRVIAEAVKSVLAFNGIALDVYFLTSQPLEIQGVEVEDVNKDEQTDTTGVDMSAHEKFCCSSQDDGLDGIADELIALGEDEGDDWQLVSEKPVDYMEEEDSEKETLLSKLINFVSTGTAKAGAKSSQDKGLFKVRYQYAPSNVSANSREFCRKMVAANKLYRKEDIIAMGSKSVNPGWGPEGANTYSIWFYKGGGDCHHYWMRKVYMRKRGQGGTFLPNEGLKNDKEVSVNEARKAGVPLEKNDPKVAKLPTDMPNNGFLKPRG